MRRVFIAVFVVVATLSISAQTPTLLQRATQLQLEIGQLVDALTPATPAPPTAIIVKAGDNLQAALDGAQPGSTIRIAAGATFQSVILRKKAAGAAITIRPDVDDSQLPAAGVRASAANLPAMFTIAPTPNGNLGISTELGAGPYTVIGMHVTSPSVTGTMAAIGDQPFTTPADYPHDIVLDRCILDGGNAAHRGVSMHGVNISVINSMVFGVFKQFQDTQAIGTSRGPGPYTIDNDYLSASGETVLIGGDDPAIEGVIPSDILISNSYLTKDLAWQASKSSVKTTLEIKNARNVTVINDVIENAWSDEQTGFLVSFTVRDQSGKAPWSTIQNVQMINDVLRHGNQAFNILGLDDIKNSTTGVLNASVRMQNVEIENVLAYDIGGAKWGGGSGTRMLFINNGPVNFTLSHVTAIGATNGFLGLVPGASKTPSANLQVTCDVFSEGMYGISGDGSVSMGAPSWLAGVDAASVFDFDAINPSGAKWKYPGANTRLAAMTFDGSFGAAPPLVCADGKPAGADVASLVAGIRGLDLSK